MPTRVCLINPPSFKRIRADYSDTIEKDTTLYQPLGLQYLSSACKKKGHEVLIIDCPAERLTCELAIEKTVLYKPDIIGVTCSTFTLIDALEILKGLKAALPAVPLVAGGPHVTIFPQETITLPYVDVIVCGEGEEVLPDLIEKLINNEPLDGLAGIGYKKAGRVVFNPKKAVIEDLDSLAFPDRTMPFDNYCSAMSRTGKVAILMTSRGCPYQCIYCDRPAMGRKFRARSAKNITEEIEGCLSKGIKEIAFFDDTFTVDRGRVVALCELIHKKHLRFIWSARARVDTVDPGLLTLMKRSGCCRISYGIESGSPHTLAILKKGTDLGQIEEAVKNTKKAGIEVFGDFIIGSPGEDKAAILRTIDLAVSLDLDYAQFTIMSLFPGTEIYRMALEQGLLKSDLWKEFALNPSFNFNTPVWPGPLTQQELERLLMFAYRRFYGRPAFMFKKLLRIRNPRELWLKARAGCKVLTFNTHKTISYERSIN